MGRWDWGRIRSVASLSSTQGLWFRRSTPTPAEARGAKPLGDAEELVYEAGPSVDGQMKILAGGIATEAAQPLPPRQPRSRAGKIVERNLAMALDMIGAAAIFLVVALSGSWFSSPAGGSAGAVARFVLICTVVFMVVLRMRKSHRRVFNSLVRSAADNLRVIEGAAFLSCIGILAIDALWPALLRPWLPPGVVVIGFASCMVVVPFLNYFGARVLGLGRKVRVVVVGTGVMADDVATRLRRSARVEVVGFVDDDPKDGASSLGSLADLGPVCERYDVDRVVVAFSQSHPERTAAVLRQLDPTVAVDIVPRFFELTGWESHLHDLHGLSVVTMGASPSRLALGLKRVVEVAIALISLVVLGPLLVAAALAVEVSSPGPVLFRQERVGRDGKAFEILKFRTMREAPEGCEQHLSRSRRSRWLADEDRTTAVGKMLRRTGIDELPQLLNVLRGDMSLVGPRPLIAEEHFAMPEWAACRVEMRPGMTGLWQVCGQHELRADELYRLDRQYVREWSLFTDLRILALTPGRLLRGGGRDTMIS
jgi:exopolysaccharide biosynthesis polyprenyl glycosylphosphotransferase